LSDAVRFVHRILRGLPRFLRDTVGPGQCRRHRTFRSRSYHSSVYRVDNNRAEVAEAAGVAEQLDRVRRSPGLRIVFDLARPVGSKCVYNSRSNTTRENILWCNRRCTQTGSSYWYSLWPEQIPNRPYHRFCCIRGRTAVFCILMLLQ
jgi:hypothetical protein